MEIALKLAAILLVGCGVAHSWLGERYILTRLFRRKNLPKLFGSDWFTIRTLRFTWHLTSVAWLGFALLLVLAAGGPPGRDAVLLVVGATFLVHFAVAAVASRGRHLSWLVFLVVGAIALYAARA